jgi:hypothetical protein
LCIASTNSSPWSWRIVVLVMVGQLFRKGANGCRPSIPVFAGGSMLWGVVEIDWTPIDADKPGCVIGGGDSR